MIPVCCHCDADTKSMLRLTPADECPVFLCSSCRSFSIQDTLDGEPTIRPLATPTSAEATRRRDLMLLGKRGRFCVIHALFAVMPAMITYKPKEAKQR